MFRGQGALECRRELSSRISVMHISSAKRKQKSEYAILLMHQKKGKIKKYKKICPKTEKKDILKV